MRTTRHVAQSFLLAAMLAVVVASSAAAQPGKGRATAPRATVAHVYLLKGLADIFSSGMDSLAEKLRRRGIEARVASHASSDALAAEVIQIYRAGSRAPIIIAGHSLGADAAVSMSQRLYAAKVPVALVVTFGPVSDPQVMGNVARAVNFYQSNSAWHGQLVRGPGFRGTLTNINLDGAADVNHFNIEKIDRIQQQAINRIVAAVNGGAHRHVAPVNQATAHAPRVH